MRSLRPHERGLHRAPNGEGWTALKILAAFCFMVAVVAYWVFW